METQDHKIIGLVNKVNTLEHKLNEITSLLKKSSSHEKSKPTSMAAMSSNNNCWNDTEKLAKIKVPLQKPQLVIKKKCDEDLNRVEEILINNKVQVAKTFKRKSGDMVAVMETSEQLDKVKNLISSEDDSSRTFERGGKLY